MTRLVVEEEGALAVEAQDYMVDVVVCCAVYLSLGRLTCRRLQERHIIVLAIAADPQD